MPATTKAHAWPTARLVPLRADASTSTSREQWKGQQGVGASEVSSTVRVVRAASNLEASSGVVSA